jgi:hypothetical protein
MEPQSRGEGGLALVLLEFEKELSHVTIHNSIKLSGSVLGWRKPPI